MPDALSRLHRLKAPALAAVLALAAVAFAGAPKPTLAQGWVITFEDDFDGSSLDKSKWFTRYIYDNGKQDHLNDEKQRYRESGNHVFEDGVLNLVAKKPNSSGVYTSGMIRSRQTFRYGYFEARIKMPAGKGLWPAFWLNSDYDENGKLSWPPEIDIMEYVQNGVTEHPFMVHSNVALTKNVQGGEWLYRDPNFDQKWTFYNAREDLTKDWHVYGLLWDTDDTVTAYLDGKKLWQRTYRWLYPDGRQAGPAHILINLAVGGKWAGAGGIDNSKFPASLQVDYVRVCKRATNVQGQETCGRSEFAPK
ncbi:glycoside hydrolase family 16 protein [Dongia sedimenti]|uniref:Glycoside hydrolase family 16 protein n=1 Tax=Dongia sedimenti TaxID=3064282 RepID=A0ABU0YTQ4_9PROT|nr:glycoside hydrolase family 16 protein [Rhodospirillaceae bacterium R-7]